MKNASDCGSTDLRRFGRRQKKDLEIDDPDEEEEY